MYRIFCPLSLPATGENLAQAIPPLIHPSMAPQNLWTSRRKADVQLWREKEQNKYNEY